MAKKKTPSVFFDFLFILSLTMLFFKLMYEQYIPVEQGTLALVALVALFALLKNFAFRKTIMAAVSLILFGIKYAGGQSEALIIIIEMILALAAMLFGIYVMFGGLSRKE